MIIVVRVMISTWHPLTVAVGDFHVLPRLPSPHLCLLPEVFPLTLLGTRASRAVACS